MKQKLHPYVIAANCKSEAEFYRKFDTPEKFFAQHNFEAHAPVNVHAGHMQMGGGIMPQIMPGLNPVQQPTRIQQPEMADGGFSYKPGYHYDGHSMVKDHGSTYNPGTGSFFRNGGSSGHYSQSGGHVMQYIPYEEVPYDEMKYGGLRAGNEYPQYIDNPVPFPAKYGGLRAGNEYPQYIDNPVPFAQMGGDIDDVDIPEFAKGGIHIKKSHIGKFTAYKKRTGKTTEEALHSKDPHVRAMANFAKNAAGWKHENGGYANPFHPIHEYMQDGGRVDVNGNPINGGAWGATSPDIPSNVSAGKQSEQQTASINDPSGYTKPFQTQDITDQPRTALSPTAPTNDQPVNVNMNNGQYDYNPPPQGPTGAQKAGYWGRQGANLLGAGIATASYFENQNSQKQNAMYQRNHGLSDNLPHQQNQFGHGLNDQNGNQRPGNNFSQTPSYSKYGGKMQQGGNYSKGQVVDLSEEEINELTRKGFKLAKV